VIPRFKPDLGWAELAALFRPNRGAVERFEKEFAKAFQAVDAVAFPYGRSAQWAFFNAVGLKNAEVIMPAYTCSVVAHAVTLSGNTPRFIDIGLDDYNMNLDKAEDAITEKTRAIIATHTFGYPQDLDRLEDMVKKGEARFGKKIWLMQDCCHAFGADWRGRMVGASGDVAVYAFNLSKIMTCVFGGMLTFQDPTLAAKVRAWRDSHFRPAGWIKAAHRRLYLLAAKIAFSRAVYGITWWLQSKTSALDALTKAYHLDGIIHFPPDYLEKMLDFEAAVGLEQLRKYPYHILKRRQAAERLVREIPAFEKNWTMPPLRGGATYSHFTIQVPNREDVVSRYARRGIELGNVIPYCLPELPAYRKPDIGAPRAQRASQSVINFPMVSK